MPEGFDRFRDSYETEVQRSIDFAGQDHAFFVEVKAAALLDLVRRRLGDPAQLAALDVGCGPGTAHRWLAGRFAAFAGTDVSAGLLERARPAFPTVGYRHFDGRTLPFPGAAFDVVFAVNVFHHVERAEQPALAAEMARVAKPGGLVALFEHNPANPLTRRAVRACPFDEGVTLVGPDRARELLAGAGLTPVERRYLLFFPWRGAAWRALERALARLPLGAQHVAAARKGVAP